MTPNPAPESDHLGYRPDIDGLRAIAVLAVVCFHVAPKRFAGGFVGVDIFFVISGFLISSIIISGLNAGTFSYREFYIRRIRRIFPALTLVFAASVVAGWYLLLPDEYRLLGKHTVASSLFAANFLLWSEAGYFDAQSTLKPFLHLWSLGVEEQFYLTWPLILAALWGAVRARVPWIVAGIVASLALCILLGRSSPTAAFYFPFTRFWQLLIGAAIAASLVSTPSPRIERPDAGAPPARRAWLLHACGWAGIGLVGVAIFGVDSQSAFPAIRAGVPTVGTALIICAGARAHVNRYLLSNRVLVFVGLISYPLYLWHWPLLSFLNIVQPDGPLRAYKLAAVILAFVLASATYLLVEKRVRRPPFVAVKWLVTASICCLIAGAVVFARGGFPAERGPWAIARTPERFEQVAMQTPECLAENAGLFSPHILSDRDFCVGSAPRDSDVVVVGDSHATRLFLGLRQLDHLRSYLDIGRGTCIPFARFEASWPETREALDCATTDANILRRAASGTPRTVILHAYFIRAFTGGLNVEHRADFSSEARDTFAQLSVAGVRTLVVLDVPVLPFVPTECVARPAFRSRVRTPCVFPASDWGARGSEVTAVLRSAALGLANVSFFDPASTLCAGGRCIAERDGDLLYTDPHHLSLVGAKLVAADILRVLDSLNYGAETGGTAGLGRGPARKAEMPGSRVESAEAASIRVASAKSRLGEAR